MRSDSRCGSKDYRACRRLFVRNSYYSFAFFNLLDELFLSRLLPRFPETQSPFSYRNIKNFRSPNFSALESSQAQMILILPFSIFIPCKSWQFYLHFRRPSTPNSPLTRSSLLSLCFVPVQSFPVALYAAFRSLTSHPLPGRSRKTNPRRPCPFFVLLYITLYTGFAIPPPSTPLPASLPILCSHSLTHPKHSKRQVVSALSAMSVRILLEFFHSYSNQINSSPRYRSSPWLLNLFQNSTRRSVLLLPLKSRNSYCIIMQYDLHKLSFFSSSYRCSFPFLDCLSTLGFHG